MPRFRCFLAVLLLGALTAGSAHAQQDPSRTQVGVGLRLNSLLTLFAGDLTAAPAGATLLVPINAGRFRVEPEIGFGQTSSEGDDATASTFHVGLGLMPLFVQGDLTLYTGGRVRYTTSSQEYEAFGIDIDDSTSRLSLGPVVGGEYFLSRRFSLGGEAGLFYSSYGREVNGEDLDLDASSFMTEGAAYLRFYLN